MFRSLPLYTPYSPLPPSPIDHALLFQTLPSPTLGNSWLFSADADIPKLDLVARTIAADGV